MKLKLFSLFIVLILCSTGCGQFHVESLDKDLPLKALNRYSASEKLLVEENVWGMPFFWFFNAENAKSYPDSYSLGTYFEAPLLTYTSGEEANYDKSGKLRFYSGWNSLLYHILYSSYSRKYYEEGMWKEDKHISYLLGLFGHMDFGGKQYCSLLFIPIPVGSD